MLLILIHPSPVWFISRSKYPTCPVDVSILFRRSFDKFERRLSETQFRDGLNSAGVTDCVVKYDVSSVR